MACKHGVETFCYCHYWFAEHQLLEWPFNDVLSSGDMDFPSCLCWENQTWTGIWHGKPTRVVIEEANPGMEEHHRYFKEILMPDFCDWR